MSEHIAGQAPPRRARPQPNRRNLTQLAVDRLGAPSGAARTFWDMNLPGFGIRVSPRGRKTWVAQYRIRGGKEVLETIGTTALIPNVRDARERARASMDKARQGIHPVKQREHEEVAARAEANAAAFTFGKLAERYLREYATLNTKPSTVKESRRLLDRAGSQFGDRPVREISKGDIVDLIYVRKPGQVGTQGLIEANNLFAAVKRCFRWAKRTINPETRTEYVDADPTEGLSRPLAKEPTRDRVLSDDEIVSFWHGCDQIGWPFGPVFQLLLVTAQRRTEVAQMRWSELDLDARIWHLPGSRTKNSRAHDVHLSDLALAIIEGLPRFNAARGKPDFVFSTNGQAAVSGYGLAKSRLDRAMKAAEPWRLHDLRRTATTGMARLGIPPHVADRVLNHQSGTIRGVAAVYNRFQYLDERRDALEEWGRFVARLINPEPNIVELRPRPSSKAARHPR